MCIQSPQTQLTLGSVFITAVVVRSSLSSSVTALILSTSADVTHASLREWTSPLNTSIWFCKANTLITAVPSHVMKQGSVTTILHSIQLVTTFYRLFSMQLPKSHTPSLSTNVPITVAPLAKHLPAFYKTWREITVFRGALHVFLSGAKETQSKSPTLFM